VNASGIFSDTFRMPVVDSESASKSVVDSESASKSVVDSESASKSVADSESTSKSGLNFGGDGAQINGGSGADNVSDSESAGTHNVNAEASTGNGAGGSSSNGSQKGSDSSEGSENVQNNGMADAVTGGNIGVNGNSRDVSSMNNISESHELPQTSESKNPVASAIGTILIGFLGLFGFKRKRKE